MNNLFWKITAIPCIFILLNSFNAQTQTPYFMSSPAGHGSGTTGGGAPTESNTVTVTDASQLSSALSGSKSVILISGTITTSGKISCTITNKSIIGLPGAKIVNLTQTKDGSGNIEIKNGSGNIIIRNIIFIGPGAYDCDGFDLLTNTGCTKLWVDHCEFQDGMDGNFDNTKLADNITVSWCKFTYLKPPKAGGSGGSDDHRFTNLVGGSDSDVPADGKYSITWLNCWWADGCVDRMVRARNAQIDMLNCYWNSKAASKNIHLSPGTNGTYVYVENGVFACSGDIVNFEKSGNNNVKFVNCSGGGSNTGTVSAPTYSYTATPSGSVVSMVTNTSCGAGATLKVNAEGIISSSCETTGVAQNIKSGKNVNPVLIDNNLNIKLSVSGSQNSRVTIYSLNGQKAYSWSKNMSTQGNLRRLNAGLYLIRMQNNESIMTDKFIIK